MINPTCFICKRELNEFGGLLVSPPDNNNKHDKLHICGICYKLLLKFLN